MKTALSISHVCLHWRKYALGWPTLWKFIDLNNSRKLIELFLSRSGDTPLELLYNEDRKVVRGATPPRQNLASYGGLILPRLRSLTLIKSLSEFLRVQNALRPLGLQPFRLRHLAALYTGHDDETRLELADAMQLDVSCLQSLNLHGLDLPWLKLPHNNVLTEFILHPKNPPILSQLLVFLFSCPLLRRLKLDISSSSALQIETPTSPLTINRIDLPILEQLALKMHVIGSSLDSTRFYYMRELSTRIGTMGPLSNFLFAYVDYEKSRWHEYSTATLAPSNFFGLIPQDTFRHFSSMAYLALMLNTEFSTHPLFHIFAASSLFGLDVDRSDPPLSVFGTGVSSPLFNRFLFEVIYTMPQVTHLKLFHEALKYLILWDLDFRNAFPCLDTLELGLDRAKYEDLKLVPIVLPKVKKLILNANRITPKLLGPIAEIVVEVLELRKCSPEKYVQLGKVISTLRQRGVVVFIYST